MKPGILYISIIISQLFSLDQNNSFNDYFNDAVIILAIAAKMLAMRHF